GGGGHRGGADMRLGMADTSAERGEPGIVGPPLGQKYALRQAEADGFAHFLQPLQRGGAGAGYSSGIAGGGEVAQAEARIIVAGTDQPVEIDFPDAHARPAMLNVSPGSRPSRAALSASSEIAP